MFSSLRFRLPAFFLAGVVIAGLISIAVATRLFQEHVRSQNLSQLKREARGLTELYAQQAIRSSDEGRSAPDFAAAELEKATGARLFYVGVPIFPGQASGLRELPQSSVDWDALQEGRVITFDFTPPGEHKSFLAVGQPLKLAGGKTPTFGALIVAKPKTELTQGWLSLVELLFVALGIGLVVSTVLAWYLSRRIATPVLALAKEADRLERLVGDVLDLAKLDAHRFTLLNEEVDMGRLVDQVYAAFGEEARRRGIDYECDADAIPVIVTDGDRVFQIVSNLVANAFRWTPDGGRVSLALAADNGTISVSVADTGPGIKPNEQERIFRPFWSRDGGGTGLGLAIARELAVALGGRIVLESEPGEGSRFDLLLPATPPS
jgi:hypothetical protein